VLRSEQGLSGCAGVMKVNGHNSLAQIFSFGGQRIA
jgi:hypothetical protein